MFYGGVDPEDKQPREILLEIVKLSDEKPKAGREVSAEIRLRNIGNKPILIPWSADPSVIEKGQDPDHLQWEQGNFEVLLRDQQNNGFALKIVERDLYGSKFASGSQLTINPGEWISASIKFRVEDQYRVGSGQFPAGESRLSLEWQQESRQWNRGKCGLTTGWFDYRNYYQQKRPAVTIQVTSSGSGKGSN